MKGYELAKKRIRGLEYKLKIGLQLNKKRKLDEGIHETQFSELKDQPLGSVPNILFWSDQQIELVNNIKSMKHTLLMGDYGTGQNDLLRKIFHINFSLRQDPYPRGCSQDAVRDG